MFEWTSLMWLLRWAGSEQTLPQVGHRNTSCSPEKGGAGGGGEGEGEGVLEEVETGGGAFCMTGTICMGPGNIVDDCHYVAGQTCLATHVVDGVG